MLPKKKKKKQFTYLDVREEYLNNGATSPPPPPSSSSEEQSSNTNNGDETNLSNDLRLRASEKRDILLYYILENFYTIDEVHKNRLYAFLFQLTELKAIDFDPFVQPGLYSNFRTQLDEVMLDVKNKGSVLPLLHGIHSSNYNYNMVSRAAIDFETVSFLGKGGFGEVIKARNRIDGAMYALKKVKFRDLPNSEKNLEKVLREVKALAQLDHENVLRYYNAWIEVEHAGDYTKKMLEAVSHKPQLPVSPVSSPLISPLSPLSPPTSPQPKFSVAVSEGENSYEDSDDDEEDEDEEEDSDKSDSLSEENEYIDGGLDLTATSTTEGGIDDGEGGVEDEDDEEEDDEEDEDNEEKGETEEEEEEEEEEEGEEGEEEEGDEDSQSRSSLATSCGVDIQFADDFSSLNLNENSNSTILSASDSGHNIVTLTGSSASSSHGSRHGINVPIFTSGELENSNVGPKITTPKEKPKKNYNNMRNKINKSNKSINMKNIKINKNNKTNKNNKNNKNNNNNNKNNNSPFHHPPPVSLHGKKPNHAGLRIASHRPATHHVNAHHPAHGPAAHHHAHGPAHAHAHSHGRRLRMSFETMLSNFRRGHEFTHESKKSKLKSSDKDKEKEKETEKEKVKETKKKEKVSEEKVREKRKEKASDESEEEWENAGTSASKEFSHELSALPYPSISSVSSVSRQPTKSPSKALAVVPFKSPATPPKNKYVLYIQMQLCESRTLKTFLESPGRMVNIVENMIMFSQIVTGLNHIHSKGLIHRDLKPENIFFSPSGAIKIGDFGLSKQFCDMSVSNKNMFDSCPSPHTMGVGTRSYASPEQIKSNFYTAKSDMYSLGIILFEMFNTFETHTERAKVLQDLRARTVSPIFYGKFPDVARCVLWLMEESSDNRPTTDEILKSAFMTLSQSPFAVTSLVVKQQDQINRLQEKILKLQEQLKLATSGN